MTPGKMLLLEISSSSPINEQDFYADLEMPAEDHEITDSLQRARLIARDLQTAMTITVSGCEILPELVDRKLDAPTLKELNFFANRLSQLSEEEAVAIRAVFQKMDDEGMLEEPVSLKDLINMTYGLDKVTVVWGMFDDEDLGRHVLDNDIHPELSKLSEEVVEMLDLASVGEWLRKTEGGSIMRNAYVATKGYELPEVYNGQTLPHTEVGKWYAFRLKVIGESLKTSQWINLPCERKQADKVAKSLGRGKIENCTLAEFESTLEGLNLTHFGSLNNFDQLNVLALRMIEMSPGAKVKFKAALEADPQESLEGFLDVAQHLREYEFMPYVSTYSAFFKEYLQHHLGTGFDSEWLSTLACGAEGQDLLERLGATITDYGAVSARGRSLFELVPYRQMQNQVLSADGTAVPQEINDQTSGMDVMKF